MVNFQSASYIIFIVFPYHILDKKKQEKNKQNLASHFT